MDKTGDAYPIKVLIRAANSLTMATARFIVIALNLPDTLHEVIFTNLLQNRRKDSIGYAIALVRHYWRKKADVEDSATTHLTQIAARTL